MTSTEILQPKPLGPEHLPEEWLQELRGLPPKSHERRVLLETIGTLATESGIEFDLDALDRPEPAETKPGFKEINISPNFARIKTSQLENRVHAIGDSSEYLTPTVVEAITDAGNLVRVVDLRPSMTASVRKMSEGFSDVERRRLDDAFWRDVAYFTDMGMPRNQVTASPKIGYTKVKGTMLRSYYTPVLDETSGGALTLARFADCRGKNAEDRLYKSVLASRL